MPQSLLFFRHVALLQRALKGVRNTGRGQRGDQFMVYVFNEIDQERRHIQNFADLGVLFCQCVGIVITPAAFSHLFRKRDKQSRGIPLLYQVPQMQ